MRAPIRSVRTLAATALLAACGGAESATGRPPVELPPRDSTPPVVPQVVSRVAPVVDRARAASDSIALTGGTIVATGADGTTYRLTVPGNALLQPVRITMTPISDVSGIAASGGRWLGVDLQPHGLHFMAPVTLDVTPAGGTAAVRAQAFAYADAGSEFQRYPLVVDRTRLRMHLLHFSGALAYVGDRIVIPAVPAPPADPGAALQQAAAALTNAERDAHIAGRPGDPRYVEKLVELHRAYFDAVVQPILTRMVSDCAFAEQNTHTALGWARSVALMLPDGSFDREIAGVMDAVIKATQNCLEEALKPCMDWENGEQVRRVLAYERQRQLIGLEGPPDIYDPTRHCGNLQGTITAVTFEGGMTQRVQATVKFSIDRSSTGAGGRSYVVSSGEVKWTGELQASPCHATVQPVSAPIRAGDGTVTILAVGTGQRYSGRGVSMLPNTSVIMACPGSDPRTAPYPVGAAHWLNIPAPGFSLPVGARSLSGSHSDGRTTWQWSLQLTPGAGPPAMP